MHTLKRHCEPYNGNRTFMRIKDLNYNIQYLKSPFYIYIFIIEENIRFPFWKQDIFGEGI